MVKGKNLTFRYSVIQFLVWLCFAPIMGYTSVFLLSKGFSNTTIGVVSASGGIASAFLQPLVASYADKEKSLSVKWIMALITGVIIFSAGMILLFGGSPFVDLFFFAVLITMIQMIVPFVNALGMQSINMGASLDFGISRGAGSLGYSLISVIIGKTSDDFGVNMIPFAAFFFSLVLLASIIRFPFEKVPLLEREEEKNKETRTGSLFKKYPAFFIYLLGMLLTFIGHNFINTFAFQVVQLKGGNQSNLGLAFGIAAASEIPVMFAFGFFLKRFKSGRLVLFGSFMMLMKSVATFFAHSMTVFYAIQLIQAFGFGMLIVAQAYYINEVMENEDKIKGQAFSTTAGTIGAVSAALIGGAVIDAFGTPVMMICSIVAAGLGFLCIGISERKMKHK